MKAGRLIPIAMALTAAVAWLSVGPADAGRARASDQVVFYADVANTVPGSSYLKNVPQVRPNSVLMFEDGSWVIEKLHWSSWGNPTARATGISSASNCKPSCARGKRTNDPVHFVVSQPRHLLGRTVYACYQLIDPKAPQTDQNDCLKRANRGSQYYYSPVAGSTPSLRRPCAHETIRVFNGARVTVRFTLHRVSCAQAHEMTRRYFQTKNCAGSACFVSLPGKWLCAVPGVATEHVSYIATCGQGPLPPSNKDSIQALVSSVSRALSAFQPL